MPPILWRVAQRNRTPRFFYQNYNRDCDCSTVVVARGRLLKDWLSWSRLPRLGVFLANQGFAIIYGGEGAGLVGALADGALSQAGCVKGILPRFMDELEWAFAGAPAWSAEARNFAVRQLNVNA